MHIISPRLLLTGLLLAGLSAFSWAAAPINIQVLGLYKDKAAVRVNGKQMLLKLGERTPNGILLVQANARRAVIEVNGVQKSYGLGSDVSTRLSKPDRKVVRIPSTNGMYLTNGLINGRSVDFLVDTGASVIAMSRSTADTLQLPYREQGKPMQVSTASELKKAWGLTLDSVTVGGITVGNVPATVIDSDHDQHVLLGMSFLSRVKFTQEQGLVVLEAQ